MRTEPLTVDEAKDIIQKSKEAVDGLSVTNLADVLTAAEIPWEMREKAYARVNEQNQNPTFHNIAVALSQVHTEFLDTSTLEERQRCFLRKAVTHAEAVSIQKKWADSFGEAIEQEFGVPREIGERAMRDTPVVLGEKWTDRVVELALLNIRNIVENASSPTL